MYDAEADKRPDQKMPCTMHERKHDAVVRDHRVADREAAQREARHDQDSPLTQSIGQRSGDGRGERRRVREEPEEQAGRERAAAEIEDVERRCRQQLECRTGTP